MPTLSANGLEICYETMGEGAPLVLIMGLGAQLIHWPEGFCQLLADRGFRLVLFDHRDVGLSTKLEDAPITNLRRAIVRGFLGLPVDAPYTLSDMAADVAGLLGGLDIEAAHIVGVSMGGMIAQVLATERPERVLTMTSMMSTTGARRYVGKPRALRALLRRAPRSREEAVEGMVQFFRTVSGPRFPIDEADIRDRAGRAYDRCFYPRGFARHLLAVTASGNRTRALARVRAPTLVVHGSADPLVPPRAGRATARAIPGARLEIVEGWGHSLPARVWPILVGHIAEHVSSRR